MPCVCAQHRLAAPQERIGNDFRYRVDVLNVVWIGAVLLLGKLHGRRNVPVGLSTKERPHEKGGQEGQNGPAGSPNPGPQIHLGITAGSRGVLKEGGGVKDVNAGPQEEIAKKVGMLRYAPQTHVAKLSGIQSLEE